MINLNLEIAEIEAILKHLSAAAYAEVAGLVAKIHGQAVPQVKAIQAANPPIDQTPVVEPESVVSTPQLHVIKEPDTSFS
jgi:hypothetical protein